MEKFITSENSSEDTTPAVWTDWQCLSTRKKLLTFIAQPLNANIAADGSSYFH
jgi:hypothetical protein